MRGVGAFGETFVRDNQPAMLLVVVWNNMVLLITFLLYNFHVLSIIVTKADVIA
jgi:hypothetical protein